MLNLSEKGINTDLKKSGHDYTTILVVKASFFFALIFSLLKDIAYLRLVIFSLPTKENL
jgi:hypothetical protein